MIKKKSQDKSIFKENDIIFESVAPDIVHVKAKDHKILASAMCRIQEYYESPFPEIKGQIFTLGQLRATGARDRPGVYTYEGGNHHDTDWSGYNWPSYCLDPFIRGLFDPLTSYEEDIVNALKCKQGKYYVIGTYGEEDDADALDHEICHALYYVNSDYRKEVNDALSLHDLSNFHDCLRKWGYADTVLDDESHAYISADYEWIFEENKKDVEKFNVIISESLHGELRAIKEKYFKEKK